MWIKQGIVILFGAGAGAGLAGGFFALLIALGILSRLAYLTQTSRYIWLYEMVVCLGGIFGTMWYLYGWKIPAGLIGLFIYGISAGIFVGAWAMALTEVIDTIPIFMRRISLKKGMIAIVWALAIGHSAGSFAHVFFWG